MKRILETDQYANRKLIRSNRIFAGAMFWCQVAFIVFYGFYVTPTPTAPNGSYNQDMVIVTGTAILVLVGFGLFFSLLKNNVWSGFGFTLLITIICFQFYYLVAGFWSKAGIAQQNPSFSWGRQIKVYLSDSDNVAVQTYGLTAVQGFKCALANIIAFSAIAGRAGPLEALIVSVPGTIIYQLVRQLMTRYANDIGGSITIFCFGGLYGSTISIVLHRCLQKSKLDKTPNYKYGKHSLTLCLFGSLICFVFFPFLNLNIPVSYVLNYQGGINTVFSIIGSFFVTIGLNCLMYGKVDLRDMVCSIIAGGIIIGASSAYIYNVLMAMLLGIVAGILQMFYQHLQRRLRKRMFVSFNAFWSFGVQGLAGGFFAAIIYKIAGDNKTQQYSSTSLQYPFILKSASDVLIGTCITAAIAIALGIIVSIPIYFFSAMKFEDLFHDRAYWIIEDDCISESEFIQQNQRSLYSGSRASKLNQVSLQKDVSSIDISYTSGKTQLKNKYEYM